MGLFIGEYDIPRAPPDETGNNKMARFADAFVRTHFRGVVLLNKDVGNNRALVLTNGNYQPGGEYECVLGEYPFYRSMSSPEMSRVYYAEFPATSAKLAAFMERCGYGEAHSRFARTIDTERVPEHNPGWVVDWEADIAYYLCFEMRGLVNKGERHVLFATKELAQLEHFLTLVLAPHAGAARRRIALPPASQPPALRYF
jgi:hypothetical protein